MRKLFTLALAISVTYLCAQTNITSCSSSFTDIGGESAQYINSESSEWLVCPDDDNKYLSIEFTYVDIETANDSGVNGSGCRDMLYIYDGMDDTAPLMGNYCGQESTDGATSFVEGNTLEIGMSFTPNNLDGCFFIRFESDAQNTRNGWSAIVECCDPTLSSEMSDGVNCPEAINEGAVFDFDVDMTCMRSGDISNFTDYEYNEFTPACMIDAEELPHKVYYKFEANDNGSFTSINVDPIDDLGEITVYAIGPLNGTCPEYSGGFIVDCQRAEDPSSLIFNMSANSSYMIVVASEVEGSFRLYSDIGTASLPVEMLNYEISKKENDVHIKWSTTQEINNKGFEIYRAYGNRDFELITEVSPQGNYSTINDYDYIDKNVDYSGDVFYFIRQVDLDGNYTEYDIKSVNFESKKSISAFPNPASSRLYVESENEEEATINIFNSVGANIYQRKVSLPIDLDVSQIPLGVYTMVIESESTVKTIRQVFQ